MRAAVIGAGVSGLTTAICLSEAGLSVEVIADRPPQETTSAAAGAIWGPHLVEPADRVMDWGKASLEVFSHLAAHPGSGVRFTAGRAVSRHPVDAPMWLQLVPDVHALLPHELPKGFVDGLRYTVPICDMPVYLDYLSSRLQHAGGILHVPQRVESLAQVDAEVVVNCTGLGSRELVPDQDMRPIRGQLVVVANVGITDWFEEDTGASPDLLCIYPQGDTVVLGGTAQDDEWSVDPDPVAARAIIDRCAVMEPLLTRAQMLEIRVGLRPTRSAVRVEEDVPVGSTRILHNYGHGGAGVSLSWGCAQDILRMVQRGW